MNHISTPKGNLSPGSTSAGAPADRSAAARGAWQRALYRQHPDTLMSPTACLRILMEDQKVAVADMAAILGYTHGAMQNLFSEDFSGGIFPCETLPKLATATGTEHPFWRQPHSYAELKAANITIDTAARLPANVRRAPLFSPEHRRLVDAFWTQEGVTLPSGLFFQVLMQERGIEREQIKQATGYKMDRIASMLSDTLSAPFAEHAARMTCTTPDFWQQRHVREDLTLLPIMLSRTTATVKEPSTQETSMRTGPFLKALMDKQNISTARMAELLNLTAGQLAPKLQGNLPHWLGPRLGYLTGTSKQFWLKNHERAELDTVQIYEDRNACVPRYMTAKADDPDPCFAAREKARKTKGAEDRATAKALKAERDAVWSQEDIKPVWSRRNIARPRKDSSQQGR